MHHEKNDFRKSDPSSAPWEEQACNAQVHTIGNTRTLTQFTAKFVLGVQELPQKTPKRRDGLRRQTLLGVRGRSIDRQPGGCILMTIRGVNAWIDRVHRARGDEDMVMTSDGLKNHFSCFVSGVRHLHHEIYRIEKKKTPYDEH